MGWPKGQRGSLISVSANLNPLSKGSASSFRAQRTVGSHARSPTTHKSHPSTEVSLVRAQRNVHKYRHVRVHSWEISTDDSLRQGFEPTLWNPLVCVCSPYGGVSVHSRSANYHHSSCADVYLVYCLTVNPQHRARQGDGSIFARPTRRQLVAMRKIQGGESGGC